MLVKKVAIVGVFGEKLMEIDTLYLKTHIFIYFFNIKYVFVTLVFFLESIIYDIYVIS